jgi:hypothetical protein
MNHQKISLIKSGIRILAFALIVATTISPIVFCSFLALIIAEVIGVVEEFV